MTKMNLFVGADRGGRTAAILSSFTATCKGLRSDPFAYLRDVMERISAHPLKRISELLADRWREEHTSITMWGHILLSAGGSVNQ